MEEIIVNELISQLNKKIEDVFIEGLKIKGFSFKDKTELENFIKLNCRCEDIIDIKQKIYYVNEIPFLLHNYESKFNLSLDFSFNVSYGDYSYI